MSYVDSDTTRAMLAFMKAAKAIEGQIQKLARGELGESARDGARKVFEAINRLDDRAYKPEIRGDAKANDLAYAMSSRLIKNAREARDRHPRYVACDVPRPSKGRDEGRAASKTSRVSSDESDERDERDPSETSTVGNDGQSRHRSCGRTWF